MSDSDATTRRVILDLEPSLDSIRGSIGGDDGARRFEGWLDLSTLLDEIRPRPNSHGPASTEDATP